MRSIWITRHGNRLDFVEPDWGKDAEYPFDPPLAPDGFEQARETARALKGTALSRIVSSPFLRCVQTSDEIAQILDIPIVLESGLGEWLNPSWFPSWPELVVANRSNRSDFRIDSDYVPVVEAEYPEVKIRMYERVAETARLLVKAGTGNELWVGHGASVQGAAAALLGISAADADRLFPEVPCCCLTRMVETPEGWAIRQACDTSHLSKITAGNRFV